MRSYRKRAYYDSMSDSRTPMSQSELAAEAEAVFEIVFDEDPNALSQSGAIGKIFDHFKRYGISNDYSDAVDMIVYIEENLLIRSHRANHKTANRPNEQQEKDFINPARELTSVDYGEFHDGSYYMSFGLGGVPNAVMVRIGDDELERVLEGLGHYYSFSADGYSFYLSFPKWEIWDHNGNGGFTISDEAMTVVHDGLFEIFLNDGMPHTSSRRVANADHAEAVDFVFSSFDKDMEEFSWWYYNDYDGLYANVEKILSRGFTGGPFDIDKIIVDVVNGESRFSKRRANRKRAYYDDYLESGGAFNYENPNYEYYTDREIEEGLRPREFDGWSNRETQLAIGATGDINVYLAVDNLAWNGTPNDIAQYYQNNIDHSGYDLNLVNWEEIWEAMRDQ